MNKYYFYNAMAKPKEINIHDTEIADNYKGFITGSMLQEHNTFKHDNDWEYNAIMGYQFNIWRNPMLKEWQEYNRHCGLNKNDYLK